MTQQVEALIAGTYHAGTNTRRGRRALLDDLLARSLKTPEFLIVDGTASLETALAAL
ncbi:MAG: hypothetical protein IPK66_12145 [Rhodospirillales bacterium]|nr:hypothetical protein [Rhodospirillales bacterium]